MWKSLRRFLWQTRLEHVFLAGLMLIGLWLRVHQLSQTMWFFDGTDEARDVLVAKHIVEYHEVISRGPFAAGGYFWLQNSPLYYYFIAFCWFFGRSPIGTLIVWAILAVSGIGLSYWAGKLTYSPVTGFLAALLYTIHPNLITVGNQIIQPHLLPLFALLFYGSLLSALKYKNSAWLIAAGGWLILPIHIHYGSLLLWPVGGLALVIAWYEASKNQWQNWHMALITSFFTCLYILGAWIFLTYKYEPGDQWQFFSLNASQLAEPLKNRLFENAEHLKNLLLSYVPNWLGITTGIGLGLGWWLGRKKLPDYLLFACSLSAGFTLLFRHYVAETYLLALLPFWILLASRVIETSWHFRWWLGLVIIGLTGWWWQDMNALRLSDLPTQSYYQHYKQLTTALYQDYLIQTAFTNTTSQPQVAIAVLASYTGIQFDGWRVGPYWSFLEELTGQQLVKLVDYDTNFIQQNQTKKYFYLICDRRDQAEKAWEMCYQAFTKPRDYLNLGTLIYSDQAFLMWRFAIDQTKLPEHFYRVYPEYM